MMSWLPKKSVLVPIDFSDASMAAVELARTFVAQPRDLTVLHVLLPMAVVEPGAPWIESDERERIDKTLAMMKERLGSGPDAPRCLVRHGSAGHEITQCASEIKAELIVIPSHGYTGLKHLLLGSVAERVVRLAHCPVLVLRS
jgi:nucleotide-binding universal stress UspA family protein